MSDDYYAAIMGMAPFGSTRPLDMDAIAKRVVCGPPRVEPANSPYYVPPPVIEVVAEAVIELTPTEWLQAFLAEGPKPAKELFTMAKARGYGRKSILTAQKRLGIKPVQRARTWLWGLPGWEDDELAPRGANLAPII
jgi:hypothetical protein